MPSEKDCQWSWRGKVGWIREKSPGVLGNAQSGCNGVLEATLEVQTHRDTASNVLCK